MSRLHLVAPSTIVAMTLAWITLDSGLGVEMASLQISSTYDGCLEGDPNSRTNDTLLERLAKRRQYTYHSRPAHLITPPRSYPRPAHGSWLVVAWFQDDLSAPVTEFVTGAVRSLAWEELAEDAEL